MNLTPIAIVAIICWAIVEIVNGGKKKKANKENNVEVEQLKQQVADMQQRIITLEKIVTDQKRNLKDEIDSL